MLLKEAVLACSKRSREGWLQLMSGDWSRLIPSPYAYGSREYPFGTNFSWPVLLQEGIILTCSLNYQATRSRVRESQTKNRARQATQATISWPGVHPGSPGSPGGFLLWILIGSPLIRLHSSFAIFHVDLWGLFLGGGGEGEGSKGAGRTCLCVRNVLAINVFCTFASD